MNPAIACAIRAELAKVQRDAHKTNGQEICAVYQGMVDAFLWTLKLLEDHEARPHESRNATN